MTCSSHVQGHGVEATGQLGRHLGEKDAAHYAQRYPDVQAALEDTLHLARFYGAIASGSGGNSRHVTQEAVDVKQRRCPSSGCRREAGIPPRPHAGSPRHEHQRPVDAPLRPGSPLRRLRCLPRNASIRSARLRASRLHAIGSATGDGRDSTCSSFEGGLADDDRHARARPVVLGWPTRR